MLAGPAVPRRNITDEYSYFLSRLLRLVANSAEIKNLRFPAVPKVCLRASKGSAQYRGAMLFPHY